MATLNESIKVSASLDEIWPFVADPIGQATWNGKVSDVRRESNQPVRLGEWFGVTYRMSGKGRDSEVEVIACDPPREVHFRHHFQWKSRNLQVDERYNLRQQGDQVEVTQRIDLSRAGIPWFFRLLIWLIGRFGKWSEQSSMEKLKEVVEDSVGR
ncbi:MAG: hypothetical protein GXP26_18005 [Planctomycetes bacterium]|nr:hypothetical protein [Planctomycetota bacterium]